MLETIFWLAFSAGALLAAYGVIRMSQSFPDEEPKSEPQTVSPAPELESKAA